MFNLRAKSVILMTTALVMFSPGANALTTPALDISSLFGGAGISNSGGTLTIDATAFSIFLEGTPLPSPIDIPDVSFSLTATYSSSSGNSHTFINGTLTAGPYMTADVGDLTLFNLGSGLGQLLETQLTYTGGSLVTGLTSGSILGTIAGSNSDDFSTDFTAGTFLAKAGPVVVPVPAAVWLFGSGLLGLVGIARRKKAAA